MLRAVAAGKGSLMTSALCVQCGAPTGLGRCLTCRGELERSCLRCGADMPPIAYDILCDPCVVAQGLDYLAAIPKRRERVQHLRVCEDCGRPTSADACPSARSATCIGSWRTLVPTASRSAGNSSRVMGPISRPWTKREAGTGVAVRRFSSNPWHRPAISDYQRRGAHDWAHGTG